MGGPSILKVRSSTRLAVASVHAASSGERRRRTAREGRILQTVPINTRAGAAPRMSRMWRRKITLPNFGIRTLVVDPLLLKAGVAVAFARHLDPPGEKARRRQEQPVLE